MIFVLLALSCGPKKEPVAVAPPPPPPTLDASEKPPTPLGARMLEHFGYATTAQQAVIAGDLPAAKRNGQLLADLPPVEGADAHWNDDLTEIRQRATVLARVNSISEAGKAVAELGRACGSCHHREERGPKPPVDELGSVLGAPLEPMARHQWATTWMWFGVIGADAAAYDAGLSVLAEPPTWDPRSSTPAYAELQARVQALARSAEADKSTENRTAVYGSVLGTCAACHGKYRRAVP